MPQPASLDPLRNPKDPLRKSGLEAGAELFRRFGLASHGFPHEAATSAAMNILINVLRQSHSTRDGAGKAFDEIVARSKSLLLDQHYDALGKRRNVFPFHQVIRLPLFKERDDF